MSSEPIVEIYIPFRERISGLRRALKSVQNQSVERWRVTVADLTSGQRAKVAVDALNDPRITLHNPDTGTEVPGKPPRKPAAYVTEIDENTELTPDFLKLTIERLEYQKSDMIIRPQGVYDEEFDKKIPSNKLLAFQFFETRRYDPVELFARLLFPGSTYCTLIFRRCSALMQNTRSNHYALTPELGHLYRMTQVASPFYFESTPLSTRCIPHEKITHSTNIDWNQYTRGWQSVCRHLISTYGEEIISEAYRVASKTGRMEELEQSLLFAGSYPQKPYVLPLLKRLQFAVKATFMFRWIHDPLAKHLN